MRDEGGREHGHQDERQRVQGTGAREVRLGVLGKASEELSTLDIAAHDGGRDTQMAV